MSDANQDAEKLQGEIIDFADAIERTAVGLDDKLAPQLLAIQGPLTYDLARFIETLIVVQWSAERLLGAVARWQHLGRRDQG